MSVHVRRSGRRKHFARFLYSPWQNVSGVATNAVTVNHVQYTPIEVPFPVIIDEIATYMKNADGENHHHVYVGLYRSVADAPTIPIFATGTTDIAISFIGRLAFATGDLVLQAGLYYVACEADNVNIEIRNTSDDLARVLAALTNGPMWYQEDLGAYLALPATATPLIEDTYAKAQNWWIRVKEVLA